MGKLSFILFLVFHCSFSQVTFVLEDLPKQTAPNAQIFISGDFEGWSGGKDPYKAEKVHDAYHITLSKRTGSIQYKFTLGSWDTVETDSDGKNISNRIYTFNKDNDTVKVSIANWNEEGLKISTAQKNVTILSNDFEIPQLNRHRRIWIYLPPNYGDTSSSYPVLYMHDGQNLFDESTSYAGEWEVDETLNELYKEKNFGLIVVGIDNGETNRLGEYSPWKHPTYGGGEGDAYLEFIIENLKPYIDNNYRTLKDKDNTAMMGSSLGGLISHYAGIKYPNVFGRIGVFSPSFWISNNSFEFASMNSNINNSKMYFLVGGKEGPKVVADVEKMITTMSSNGFEKNNIYKKIVPQGEHKENFWKQELKEAIRWLFSE